MFVPRMLACRKPLATGRRIHRVAAFPRVPATSRLGLVAAVFCVLSAISGAAVRAEGDASLTVTGTVTDPQEQPVADARIYLVHTSSTADGEIVVTKGTTNADGTWSIAINPTPTVVATAIVHKAGLGIGAASNIDMRRPAQGGQMASNQQLNFAVKLSPARSVQFRLVDADDQPIDDAKIFLQGLFSEGQSPLFYWLEPHVKELSWTTADDGQITIDSIPANHFLTFRIESERGGSQMGFVPPGVSGDAGVLKLNPVCPLEIQLVADDPALLNNRTISIQCHTTRPSQRAADDMTSTVQVGPSVLTVRTDALGQATAVVTAGSTSISVADRPDDTLFATQMSPIVTNPGEPKRVEINFTPGIQVQGSVVTETGKPIEGVELSFHSRSVRTGADGKYVVTCPKSNHLFGNIVSIPDGYAKPLEEYVRMPGGTPAVAQNGTDAATVTKVTLPPMILRRAIPMAGIVRDESGEPVAGATVTAKWVQRDEAGQLSTMKSDTATSGADGTFQLESIYPDVDVHVSAATADKSVVRLTEVNSGSPSNLELTVSSEGMVFIVGAVMGLDGNVVPNAEIQVTSAMFAPGGHMYGSHIEQWDGHGRKILTDENGLFRSPRQVARYGKYSFRVSAPGYVAAETGFQEPSVSGKEWQLDQFVLTKARTIRGFVRGSAGQPIAGAAVSSWIATADNNRNQTATHTVETDDSGQFTLTDIHPRAVLAFVRCEGYRPSGAVLTTDDQDLSLTVYRNDEAIPPDQRIVPQILDQARRRAAAMRLIDAMLPEQRNANYFYSALLEMMNRLDPNAAAAELTDATSADARAKMLAQLGEIEDAMAETEAIEDGYMRTFTRLELLKHVESAEQRREILSTALVDAQTITRPDRRAVIVAMIVEKYAELGDNDRVATILRDELPQVQALSNKEWAGFARGFFAAQLARVEPQTALTMASEAAADDQVRHYQNIAHILGNLHPELAEQTLGRISENRYVNSPVVRVVYRMATADLDRAIRLADGIQDQSWPGEKARGIGVIAWAIHDTQPEKARELLRRAYAALPDLRGTHTSYADASFGAAMDLLRWAEQIDPERVTDYFWTTVSYYGGPSAGAWSPDEARAADVKRQAQLALLLALYPLDVDLPKQMIQPVFEYWHGELASPNVRFTDQAGTFMAMAMADPERAVDFAAEFYEALPAEQRRYIPQPWEVIGNTLTQDREAIGKTVTQKVFHRWVIDNFDL